MRVKVLILRLVLTSVLAVFVAASASAGAWIQWGGGPQIQLTKVEIPLWERENGLERYVYQLGSDWYAGFEFDLECDYPDHILAVGGGDSFVDEGGLPIYVRIAQAVKNVGTESWIDFHIRAADGGYPYKVYGSWWPAWNLSSAPASGSHNGGWDYIMPEGGRMVKPNETLYDEVWIRVDPSANSFTLDKWPTIPEPGSLMSLATGFLALGGGFGLRRFRK